MLTQSPKTKSDLVQAIQRSTIRSFDVYEGLNRAGFAGGLNS